MVRVITADRVFTVPTAPDLGYARAMMSAVIVFHPDHPD
jgi:hypothetical protein